MVSATSQLLQSEYFSPIFNTAVFDGPVRIYFSQHQEPEVLSFYFELKKKFDSMWAQSTSENPIIFILLYPTENAFKEAFGSDNESELRSIGSNFILGIKGPFREDLGKTIEQKIQEFDFIDRPSVALQ